MRRSLILVGAALTSAVLLTGCSADNTAASYAERIIIGIGDDITPAYPTPLNAEELAAWALEDPRVPPESDVEYDIEVLDWSGNSGDPEGALIDFRIGVHLLPRGASTIGDLGQKEGQATRCWELTIFGLHDYDSLQRREIGCPSADTPPRHPRPRTSAALPANAAELMTEALTGATEQDLPDRLRDVFPDDRHSIEIAVEDDELIAAVGSAATQSCRVGVRHADGTIEVFDGFDPESLLEGEVGCRPELYLWSFRR